MDMEQVVVKTVNGLLRGRRNTTGIGTVYFSFKGIPFAQPPVGPLRFQAPTPAEDWPGIRDAFNEGPVCAQYEPFTGKEYGQEDCLYLNVYTPTPRPADVDTENDSDLLPVMVWFHGGGFSHGSGNSDKFGPDFLVNHHVVLVTFNYRLHVLGFLCMPSAGIHGNMGLKDQTMALKWVQDNIVNFGGDPKNVTLFGQSSGAAAIHMHMMSPMSEGLFHKAVLQSGSALCRWAMTSQSEEHVQRLCHSLGTEKDDPRALQTLLTTSGLDLAKHAKNALSVQERISLIPFPFLPIVDGEFLTDHPLTLVKQGAFKRIPVIMGVTSQEGIISIRTMLSNGKLIKKLNTSFDVLLPHDNGCLSSEVRRELAARLREYYFGGQVISKGTSHNFIQLVTDLQFHHCVIRMARAHSAVSSPVYLYEFDFDGNLNYMKKFLRAKDFEGASHSDELGYLFNTNNMLMTVPGCAEGKVVDHMTSLWTSFARSGVPRSSSSDVTWPEFTSGYPVYLQISEDLRIDTNMNERRMKFWDDLYQFSEDEKCTSDGEETEASFSLM